VLRVRSLGLDSPDGRFRVMYVAKFEEALYVLHGFQKKTRKTSRSDIDIAKTRYRVLVAERVGKRCA
jgi:phage-related protein